MNRKKGDGELAPGMCRGLSTQIAGGTVKSVREWTDGWVLWGVVPGKPIGQVAGWKACSLGKSGLDNHEDKMQRWGKPLQPSWDGLGMPWKPPGVKGPQLSVQRGKHVVAAFFLKEAFGVAWAHSPFSVELWCKRTVEMGCWKQLLF